MGIGKAAGEAALELAENKEVLNKTSNILGMLFPYVGLKKKALDMYISDVEQSNLSSESKLIAVLNAKDTMKKLKNQKKIAEIAIENAKDGTDFTSKSSVNEEWLERFMDSAKFVSSEDVQIIWGKILSKEFEKPGSTPLNMTRILSEITSEYAQAFKKICSMQIMLVEINSNGDIVQKTQKVMVPYKYNPDAFGKIGLSFNAINELETLGLIKLEPIKGYVFKNLTGNTVLSYINGKTETIVEYKTKNFPMGNIVLTKVGACLKDIIPLETIVGYEDIIKNYLLKRNVKYMDESNYQIIVDGKNIQVEKRLT